VRGGCCTGPWRRTSRFVGTVVGRSVASSIGFGSQAGSLRHGRGPCSPSPRPSPAAARVLFTGRRFAGEGVTRRGIGFQPVREMIFRQWLAVSVGRWLTGCGACWCAGISKDGPSARRLEAYATDVGPVRPHPGPLPQSRGCCLAEVVWWERGHARLSPPGWGTVPLQWLAWSTRARRVVRPNGPSIRPARVIGPGER